VIRERISSGASTASIIRESYNFNEINVSETDGWEISTTPSRLEHAHGAASVVATFPTFRQILSHTRLSARLCSALTRDQGSETASTHFSVTVSLQRDANVRSYSFVEHNWAHFYAR